MQEVKCTEKDVAKEVKSLGERGYKVHFHCGTKPGYAGTAYEAALARQHQCCTAACAELSPRSRSETSP
jgi:exonuclease III